MRVRDARAVVVEEEVKMRSWGAFGGMGGGTCTNLVRVGWFMLGPGDD